MIINRIINEPLNSNCYIINLENSNDSIVIDPGSEKSQELLNYLNINKLVPKNIILTHSHFDHIRGVNVLKREYNSRLICSSEAGLRITDPKKNYSKFQDGTGFSCDKPDEVIYTDCYKKISGIYIDFIITKGHSDCSLCILIDNCLFTGDTVIKDLRTLTNFKDGNKEKLRESLIKLQKILNKQTFIFGGHGDSFLGGEFNIKKYLGE